MTVVADFRDRLNSDAKFAAQFADVKDESSFIMLANQTGYALAPQDIYDNVQLTDEDLEVVQGGILAITSFILFMLALTGSVALSTGAGVGIGIGISAATKKKK